MPVESGNQAIKDGTLGAVVQRAAERWKPEAMYFTTFDGRRTAFHVCLTAGRVRHTAVRGAVLHGAERPCAARPGDERRRSEKGLSQLG